MQVICTVALMLMRPPLIWLALLATLTPACHAQDDHSLYFGRGGTVSVEHPALPAPDAGLTVACWFRSSARLRKPVRLISCWAQRAKDPDPGRFFLGLTSTNRLGLGLRNAAGKEVLLTSAATWRDGRWHHAAGTWDGTAMVVYLDGKELARKELAEFGPLRESALPLVLGPYNAAKVRNPVLFEGYIADVALWNRALSAEDMAGSLISEPGEGEPGLLAYYPLRAQAPRDLVEDESGAGNQGRLSPELARVGWARTRARKDRNEDGPGLDFFCFDLSDVLTGDGRRIFVSHQDRAGVLWQDRRSGEISVTWIDSSLRSYRTIGLSVAEDAVLAAGTTDEKGNIYYLAIQEAPRSRPAGFEVVATLSKVAADGKALVERELDVSKSGLNIFSFSSRVLSSGNLRHSKGILGLILPRTMHRSSDGLRHQGAIAVTFSAKDLSRLSNLGQTSGHSKANFLTVSAKGSFLGLDLGDNYPRGVHLHEFTRGERHSRLVFTFKTAHSTRPRNGSPVYDEISQGGKTFYKNSNDNSVYTELGGLVENRSSYTIVFSTDQSLDGRVLDNSRAFRGCQDPRNLALVQVVKNFQRARRGSEISDAIMVDLPRKVQAETGGYYDFGGRWHKQRVVGVTWLTRYESGEAAHAPQLLPRDDGTILLVWEKTGQDASLRAMVIEPDGEVVTPEFSLPFFLSLNRQDRVLSLGGRTHLLASDGQGGGTHLYFLGDGK